MTVGSVSSACENQVRKPVINHNGNISL